MLQLTKKGQITLRTGNKGSTYCYLRPSGSVSRDISLSDSPSVTLSVRDQSFKNSCNSFSEIKLISAQEISRNGFATN